MSTSMIHCEDRCVSSDLWMVTSIMSGFLEPGRLHSGITFTVGKL